MGDRLASPLLDRYLGATGFRGQQGAEPVSPDRQDNLWQPVPGDHGAHGRFDAQARRHSIWLELSTRPRLSASMIGAAAALAAGLLFGRKKG